MPGLWEFIDTTATALLNVGRPPLRRAVPPAGIPTGHFLVGTAQPFGESSVAEGLPVTVPLATFSKHCCMFGASGCGKTTTAHGLRDAFVVDGMNLVDIDYRGDGYDETLRRLVALGVDSDRLTLIDLRLRDQITPLNVLGWGQGSPETRAAVMFGAIRDSVDLSGVQLAMDLRMALSTLAEMRGSLLDVSRLLLPEGQELRDRAISESTDGYVREALVTFDALAPEVQRTREAAVRNKLDPFLINPTLRASLALSGAPDMGQIMNEPGHCCLVALGADRNPEARLVGRMLVSAVQRAAMARVDVSQSERNPVRLVVDEAQNILGEETCQILAEGRRYALGITLMCQFRGQLIPELRESVKVNCATQLQFQTAASEASDFASEVVASLSRDEVKRLIQSAPVGTAVCLRRGEPAAYVSTPNASPPRFSGATHTRVREAALTRTTTSRVDAEAFLAERSVVSRPSEKEVGKDVRKPFRR